MNYVEITCQLCGKTFTVPSYYRNRYKTCGSKTCKFKFRQEIGKKNKNRKQSDEEKLVRSLALKGRKQIKSHIEARTAARKSSNAWFSDPEIGAKISAGKKAAFEVLPESEKAKIRKNARDVGKKYCYRHGKTAQYRILINGTRMANWAKSVKERDNFTCQNCGKRNLRLEAHHIKNILDFPRLRYDLNNGITLCSKCHKLADIK